MHFTISLHFLTFKWHLLEGRVCKVKKPHLQMIQKEGKQPTTPNHEHNEAAPCLLALIPQLRDLAVMTMPCCSLNIIIHNNCNTT